MKLTLKQKELKNRTIYHAVLTNKGDSTETTSFNPNEAIIKCYQKLLTKYWTILCQERK